MEYPYTRPFNDMAYETILRSIESIIAITRNGRYQ